MRKIATTIVCVCLLVQLSFAQSPDARNAISYNHTLVDYYSPFIEDIPKAGDFLMQAVKLGYHRNLSGPLNLEVPIKFGAIRMPTPTANAAISDKLAFGSLDALLQLQHYRPDNLLVPYLSAGVGGVLIEDEGFDFQIPAGVGVDVRFAPNFYLQLRSEYRLSLAEYDGSDKTMDNLNHHIGFKVFLGAGAEKEPPAPLDTDGDGIPDTEDKCPLEAGKAELQGCPDTDGDGVANGKDDCPEVAGLPAFNGCPDTDGDGVPDLNDDCPNESGLVKNNGCPELDADGDGVPDASDRCPNEAGTIMTDGCPDADGDGVADGNDDCPDLAGMKSLRGCPDTDGDAVADHKDDCPTKAGPRSNNGCPEDEIKEEDQQTLDFAAQNIQFKVNSSYLETGSSEILDQVADILQRYPKFNANIDGHTDSAGKEDYNQWLSERRAKRCYDYLASKGIAAERLNFKGYGESNPIADNKTVAGQEENRRVEFNLYLKE